MLSARLGTIALAIAILWSCGDDADTPVPEADAGVEDDRDAGGGIDAGSVPSEPEQAGGRAGVCYDGIDNDADDVTDCAAGACANDAVCCVGSSDAGCCEEAAREVASLTVPGSDCEDAAAADCAALDGYALFGDATPRVEAGTLVPLGGSGTGGLVLSGPLDPRRGNVVLTARLEVPTVRCTDCIDAAGVGFVTRVPAAGERAAIDFGLLASGARREFLIYVSDEVVGRLPLADGANDVEVRLVADGSAVFTVPGSAPIQIAPFAGLAALTPVVFGRTDNRPAGVRAVGVRSASVTMKACDAPSALARSDEPVLPSATSTFAPGRLGRISVARAGPPGEERTYSVYEHEGALHLARETLAGSFRGEIDDPGPPLLEGPPGTVRLMDPWLTTSGTQFVLFYVVEDEAAVRRIHRAEGGPGWTAQFVESSVVLSPEALPGVTSVDGPAVWRDDADVWHMIARVHSDDGEASLVAFVEGDELGWAYARGSLAESRVLSPSHDDLFAFDRDEVATPAVVAVTNVRGARLLALYYAGRRGTRWSIGLLATQDGGSWRRVGPVLAGRGQPSADGLPSFDGLSVLSPAPLSLDGTSMDLLYLGTDGSEFAYGRAHAAGPLEP